MRLQILIAFSHHSQYRKLVVKCNQNSKFGCGQAPVAPAQSTSMAWPLSQRIASNSAGSSNQIDDTRLEEAGFLDQFD